MGARSLAVLASATACLAAAVPATASARTLVVDDDGGCRDARYSTIQSAVDAAASGDVVRVCPGTYEELVSVTTAVVRLVSATPHAAVIKAPAASTGAQALVSLGARNVRLLDLTLSGPWPAAASGNCAIDNAVGISSLPYAILANTCAATAPASSSTMPGRRRPRRRRSASSATRCPTACASASTTSPRESSTAPTARWAPASSTAS